MFVLVRNAISCKASGLASLQGKCANFVKIFSFKYCC